MHLDASVGPVVKRFTQKAVGMYQHKLFVDKYKRLTMLAIEQIAGNGTAFVETWLGEEPVSTPD